MTEWYTNGGKLASFHNLKLMTRCVTYWLTLMLNAQQIKFSSNGTRMKHCQEPMVKAIMKMRGDVPTIYGSWEVIYKAVKRGN